MGEVQEGSRRRSFRLSQEGDGNEDGLRWQLATKAQGILSTNFEVETKLKIAAVKSPEPKIRIPVVIAKTFEV
jgi:hypothetical protein